MRSGNSPSYLIKEPYSYYFRIMVPKDLQPAISKKELRYSLRTGNLSEAKSMARYLAGRMQTLFRGIQKGCLKEMDISKDQINEILKGYFQDLIKEYDEPAIPNWQQKEDEYHNWASDEEAVKGSIEVLEDIIIPEHNAKLKSGDYSEVEPIAIQMLEENGITEEIDTTSSLYHYLCSGLLSAKIEGFKYHKKRLEGQLPVELQRIFGSSSSGYQDIETVLPYSTQPNTTLKAADHGLPLSELIEKFGEFKTNWDASAKAGYKTAMNIMLKILGDIPVGTITTATMVDYRETLLKAPTYWTTRHDEVKVTDLPVSGVNTMSKGSIDKHMSFVRQLMDYAMDRRCFKEYPMPRSRMSLPDDKIDVHAFNDEQVKTIMKTSRGYKDEKYWIPRLGYYTGCRLNELCQLHREDLREVDGIWCLDINDEGKKTLKNKGSRRLIPLHPVLIEMGFIGYAQGVKHHRIFPGCKYREKTKKYRNGFSKWFSRTCLVKANIKESDDRSITFHSFRHMVYTVLKRQGVEYEHVDQIVGHRMSQSQNDTYNHGYLLSQLKSDVDLIPDHRIL